MDIHVRMISVNPWGKIVDYFYFLHFTYLKFSHSKTNAYYYCVIKFFLSDIRYHNSSIYFCNLKMCFLSFFLFCFRNCQGHFPSLGQWHRKFRIRLDPLGGSIEPLKMNTEADLCEQINTNLEKSHPKYKLLGTSAPSLALNIFPSINFTEWH